MRLALALTILSSAALPAAGSEMDDLKGVADYAERVTRDLTSPGTAGLTPELTVEAQRRVTWDDARNRATRATRYGEIVRFRNTTCTEVASSSMERCPGKFFLCGADFDFASGGAAAKVAVCMPSAGHWRLGGFQVSYPDQTGAREDVGNR